MQSCQARIYLPAVREHPGVFVVAAVSVCILGCGKQGPELFSVEGVVTHKNRPVDYGHVTLIPASGPPIAPAVLQSDGRFRVMTAAGRYTVVVNAIPPAKGAKPDPLAEGGLDYSQAKPSGSLVPLKYARPETSGVSVVVEPTDENTLVIELP